MKPAADSPLPAVVGMAGIAPTLSRFQRDVQTGYTTFPKKNWHGRQVTLLHRAVLETAALLVGHVRVVPEAGSAPAPAVWKTAMHL